MAHQARFKTL